MSSITRFAIRALVASSAASAFAFAGSIHIEQVEETVAIELAAVDREGRPIQNVRGRFAPREPDRATVEFALPGPFSLPFPALGRMTLAAEGYLDRVFDVALARADQGRIADVTIPLEPAREIALRTDSIAAGTIGLPLGLDSRKLRFDSPAAQSLTGRSRIPLPLATTRLAVFHDAIGFTFCAVPIDETPLALDILGREIAIECRPSADWLLAHPVEMRISADGVEASFSISQPGVRVLQAPSGIDLRIQCDAPGANRFDRTIPAASDPTKVALELQALPLAFARVEARDAVTRELVPIEALAIGRARANDRDRIDFAPEWNTVTLARGDSFLIAAPQGANDLLVTTRTHYQTLQRRTAITGTRDAPTAVTISVERSLPIQGIVTDAATKLGVANARITLRKTSRDLEDLPFAWKVNGSVGFLSQTRTRKDGRFTLESTVWEDVTLEVEADGYAPAWLGPIERRKALDLGVELHHGSRVAGKAARHDVGELAYLIEERSNRVLRAEIDDEGSFVFVGVAPGRYRGHIGTDDRAWAFGVLGSQGTRKLELLHDPRGSRSLRVEITGDREAIELPRIEIDEK